MPPASFAMLVEPGAEAQVANATAVVAARAERHRAAVDAPPSAERNAQPVVVPRSSARIVPWAMPNDCAAAGLASAAGKVKVVEAMMVSVEGIVVVRTATERFLAELSVVVRLLSGLRSFVDRHAFLLCRQVDAKGRTAWHPPTGEVGREHDAQVVLRGPSGGFLPCVR